MVSSSRLLDADENDKKGKKFVLVQRRFSYSKSIFLCMLCRKCFVFVHPSCPVVSINSYNCKGNKPGYIWRPTLFNMVRDDRLTSEELCGLDAKSPLVLFDLSRKRL